MKTISRLAILLIVALLVPATLAADATHNHDHDHGHDHDHHAHVASHVDGEQLVPIACFAPGSDQSLVDNAHRRFHDSRLRHSLDGMVDRYQFSDSARWSATATDGSGLGQGDITTITWSIVPDGTSIFGYNGEPTAPSNLRAWLNGIYGSESVWLPLFQSVFDRWEELTGMNYVYEPNDDGSAWTSTTIASGQLGVRGDVRISGHFIDGNSNVLAYNFFPDFGDMVIDTADNFYNTTSGNSLRLRNVLSHEHGHGMGLNHVCPVNQTKLMEPFASTAFDGPQFDDILAINRGYGDNFENNDTPGTAASLGSIPFGTGVTLGNSTAVGSANVVAIDDNSDTDVYAFTVSGAGTVDVTVSPIGATYLNGPQNANGSCSAGTTYNANDNQNLSFEILGTNGSTVLASVNNTGAGSAESVSGVNLASAGTYFVEISGPSNDVQRYQLDVDVDAGAANTAPTVNISNPSNGASFTQGTSVSFSGSASDAEDGSLTGSLAWSSSLDGSIGSGGSFSTSSLSVGSHTITASVTDSGGLSGNDSISLTITSGGGGGCVDCIDWSTTTTVSFATQDASSNVTVEDGGDTLFLQQNTWRRTTQTYAVTANTVVEFDFLSTSQGEIHGIGLDEDNNLSSNRIFKVHGTQNYGITDFDNYVSGWTTYQIPVGQYYTGSSFFLVLVNDKDAGALNNNSRFRNVRIFEDTPGGGGSCTVDDDFEGAGAGTGWTTSGSCSTGTFVLGNPTQQTNSGVTTQVGGAASGSNALFTATNTSAGNADVDGGECVLTSPTFNVTTASNLAVNYFHGQRDAGDDPGDDYFVLEYSTNGGTSYTSFVSIGDVQNNAAWTAAGVNGISGNVVLRVRVSDGAGPGDLVEGGIDDVSICEP